MERLGHILGGLPIFQWARAWKACAGPALLKQVKFMGVHRQGGALVLHLHVADPVWRQEILYQKADLLRRFNQLLRADGVAESECPTDCLLGPVASMPVKTGHPKKSRYK